MRGLVYGTVMGGVSLCLIGTMICSYYDLRNIQDVKMSLQRWKLTNMDVFQERFLPIKTWAQKWSDKFKVRLLCDVFDEEWI